MRGPWVVAVEDRDGFPGMIPQEGWETLAEGEKALQAYIRVALYDVIEAVTGAFEAAELWDGEESLLFSMWELDMGGIAVYVSPAMYAICEVAFGEEWLPILVQPLIRRTEPRPVRTPSA